MTRELIVLGASGFVSSNLISSFKDDFKIHALSRKRSGEIGAVNWIQQNSLEWGETVRMILSDGSRPAVIFTSGTTNLRKGQMEEIYQKVLPSVVNATKEAVPQPLFIFFSAGSVERDKTPFAEFNRQAEEYIKSNLENYLILRPTLIYGPHEKKNLSLILGLVSWIPVFPLPKPGQVVLQPVYVDDISKFIRLSIDGDCPVNATYTLAGPAPVDLCDLVTRAQVLQGKKRFYLRIDLSLVKKLIRAIGKLLPFLKLAGEEQIMNSRNAVNWDNSRFKEILGGDLTDYDTGIRKTLKLSRNP